MDLSQPVNAIVKSFDGSERLFEAMVISRSRHVCENSLRAVLAYHHRAQARAVAPPIERLPPYFEDYSLRLVKPDKHCAFQVLLGSSHVGGFVEQKFVL